MVLSWLTWWFLYEKQPFRKVCLTQSDEAPRSRWPTSRRRARRTPMSGGYRSGDAIAVSARDDPGCRRHAAVLPARRRGRVRPKPVSSPAPFTRALQKILWRPMYLPDSRSSTSMPAIIGSNRSTKRGPQWCLVKGYTRIDGIPAGAHDVDGFHDPDAGESARCRCRRSI